jgi:hypothetical protein
MHIKQNKNARNYRLHISTSATCFTTPLAALVSKRVNATRLTIRLLVIETSTDFALTLRVATRCCKVDANASHGACLARTG